MDVIDLPYIEEKVIGGVLHYRENDGDWIAYTASELTDMYMFEMEMFEDAVLNG